MLRFSWKFDPNNFFPKSFTRRATPLWGDSMRNEYDFSKGKRGAIVAGPKGKTRITIRVDEDVVQWFKAQVHKEGGGNYQTLMNHALREYMISTQEPFEEVLRRVLREELKNAG